MTLYQPGIPTGTVPLNQDYLNIQKNFTQLNNTYLIDHVAFNVLLNNGYHKSVHLVSQSTTASNPPNNQPVVPPATTAGVGQVFSSQINNGLVTDTALYYLSGNGIVTQLTTPTTLAPSPIANGYTYLPGGLILQWGTVTTAPPSSALTGTVTFPINFPNNIFMVNATSHGNTSGGLASVNIRTTAIGPPSTFGWLYSSTGGSAGFNGFYWVAIGN